MTATPTRSLRNEIARAILNDTATTGESWHRNRRALEDANAAVEAIANYVLIFGPEALIQAVS